MIVYSFKNDNNEYLGERKAQKDPLNPGKYLIPKKSTVKKPPVVNDNEVAVFEDGKWEIKLDHRGTKYYDSDGNLRTIENIGETVPTDGSLEPPEPIELTYSELRQRAFRVESDPVFFEYQRGEATYEDWITVVNEIRKRYPKP